MNSLKIKNLKFKIPPRQRFTIGIDASRAFVKEPAGPEYYSLRLIEALAKIDHKNHYILYLRAGQKPNFRLPQNFEAKIINFFYLWTQLGLAFETILHPPDVLFIPSHTLPVLSSIFLPQLPIVVTIHGLEGKYLPHSGNFLAHIYRNWSIDWAVRAATALIAVSKDTKDDILNTYKNVLKDIIVIHEGVDFERFNRAKKENLSQEIKSRLQDIDYKTRKAYSENKVRKLLLFVGTLQPRKNLVRLIKAFSQLPQKNSCLLLAGKPGWLYEPIMRAPKRFNIEDRVVFLGRVNDEDLPALYKAADLFVLPSLTEGFGLPLLEAQAAGVPVVASNRGALPEVGRKGAIFVDPLSIESIKRGILRVLKSKRLKSHLIKKGLENAADFSWGRVAYNTRDYLLRFVKSK